MMRGLWKLTWLEIKIFLREPLGAFGSILFPVLIFVAVSRFTGGRLTTGSLSTAGFLRVGLPVFVSVFISLSGVLSLVTIISIYREGGILKRLRATPLRPQTILTAHVLVKLTLTALTMALMVLAGKRYYPAHTDFPVFGFTVALLISTWSILSIGFLLASIVPTARFAQPIGAIILYPMIAVSGLFVPVESFPPVLHAVADWHTDPFQFVEKDGYFYGRGTHDMKDSDAVLVATFLRLHREGYKPKRDLILALTADEEGGKFNGANWLVTQHRDLVDAAFVINPDSGGVELDHGRALVADV